MAYPIALGYPSILGYLQGLLPYYVGLTFLVGWVTLECGDFPLGWAVLVRLVVIVSYGVGWPYWVGYS